MVQTAYAAPPVRVPDELEPARPMMADPMPVSFALFALALAFYGVRFVGVDAATIASGPASEGLKYAVLIAGIGQTLAGVLGIIRGLTYPAYVSTTFGIWLLGFFLLVTSGAATKEFTPDALAWYVLVLVVPVAIMSVPAIAHRNVPFIIAFAGLLGLLLLLGLGYHHVYDTVVAAKHAHTAPDLSSAVRMLKASAWCAFAAAAAIWWVFASEVYRHTGVLRAA
jgi:succinate-acetate transporter protein